MQNTGWSNNLFTKLTIAVLVLLVMATVPLRQTVKADGMNVIFGTRSYTKGNSHDDTIIACPSKPRVLLAMFAVLAIPYAV